MTNFMDFLHIKIDCIFKKQIKKILEVDSWPKFYKMCALSVPSPVALTNLLKQAVKNSLNRGYHNPKTNFAGIQASGVSRILLKGQTYSCNTNIKRIYLEEVWGWEKNCIYLDASCLAYSFDGSFNTVIDYCHLNNESESLKHSGDILDPDKNTGKHMINITLDKLPADIKTLFFTMSSWTTYLTEILDPYVLFIDPDTKQSLCGYEFTGKNTGTNTSVIMAKLYREKPGGSWTVKAIGHLGEGRADHYDPIKETITNNYL